MFHPTFETRWQAFGAHLFISLLLFIVMCIIIVVFWYPGTLFTTEGGWQGVRLIAGIDFIIGPTLTLIVYKKGKRGLKFDLTLIGALQISCILYGMYTVHYSRPAVVAYADGTFYTTPLIRFDSREINISDTPLLQNKMPVWVNIKLPTNKAERIRIKLARLESGLETSIDLYESYDKAIPLLPDEGFSIQQAQAAGLSVPIELDPTTSRIFKLITRYDSHAVAVNLQTGKFHQLLGTIDPRAPGLIPMNN